MVCNVPHRFSPRGTSDSNDADDHSPRQFLCGVGARRPHGDVGRHFYDLIIQLK